MVKLISVALQTDPLKRLMDEGSHILMIWRPDTTAGLDTCRTEDSDAAGSISRMVAMRDCRRSAFNITSHGALAAPCDNDTVR